MRNKKPSIRRVYSTPDDATDVSEFIQDLNLPEQDEEMEAIADTFWGVENLNGVFNWEGSDCQKSMRHHQKQCRHFKSLESHPKEEFVYQTKPDERDMESRSDNMDLSIGDMRVKRVEPKVNTFIGYIWRRWQQKAFHTTPVELTEFASEQSKESKVPSLL